MKSYTGSWLPSNSMTLDDLERQNKGLFIDFFGRFRAARHISRANCTVINWDRHEEAAYKICSIERRFWRSKTRFSRFKETCERGHKVRYPRKSRYFTSVGQSFVKTVADRHGHAAYCNKHYSDELLGRSNIDDFERPWTFKIRNFYWFLRSLASAHTPRMNCDEMAELDRLTVCEQKLLWAFARFVIVSSNCLLLNDRLTALQSHSRPTVWDSSVITALDSSAHQVFIHSTTAVWMSVLY